MSTCTFEVSEPQSQPAPYPKPPRSLNRSGVACFDSIIKCIEEHPGECHLWTLTLKELRPDYYIAACRRRLFLAMQNDQRSSCPVVPEFGGVRVVEIHPRGHGLHDHCAPSWSKLSGQSCRQIPRPPRGCSRPFPACARS
jgi:hypothetical protein